MENGKLGAVGFATILVYSGSLILDIGTIEHHSVGWQVLSQRPYHSFDTLFKYYLLHS